MADQVPMVYIFLTGQATQTVVEALVTKIDALQDEKRSMERNHIEQRDHYIRQIKLLQEKNKDLEKSIYSNLQEIVKDLEKGENNETSLTVH